MNLARIPLMLLAAWSLCASHIHAATVIYSLSNYVATGSIPTNTIQIRPIYINSLRLGAVTDGQSTYFGLPTFLTNTTTGLYTNVLNGGNYEARILLPPQYDQLEPFNFSIQFGDTNTYFMEQLVTNAPTAYASGVIQLTAGTNIVLVPSNGVGVVQINSTASGGGGGGSTTVIAVTPGLSASTNGGGVVTIAANVLQTGSANLTNISAFTTNQIMLVTNAATPGTSTKVTYNAQGLITSGATLSASDIPSLDASKITTGTFSSNNIPSDVGYLDHSNTWTAAQALTNAGNIIKGNGTGLTNTTSQNGVLDMCVRSGLSGEIPATNCAADYAGQIGLSYESPIVNGASFWVSLSTTKGDWRLLYRISSTTPMTFGGIGGTGGTVTGGYNNTTTAEGNQYIYYNAGSFQQTNQAFSASDAFMVLANMNPFMSGTGYSLADVFTNMAGGSYIVTPFASQYCVFSRVGATNDGLGLYTNGIGKPFSAIVNNPGYDFYLMVTKAFGTDPQPYNYSLLETDGANERIHFPFWISGVRDWQNSSNRDAMTIDERFNFVTISNYLYIGTNAHIGSTANNGFDLFSVEAGRPYFDGTRIDPNLTTTSTNFHSLINTTCGFDVGGNDTGIANHASSTSLDFRYSGNLYARMFANTFRLESGTSLLFNGDGSGDVGAQGATRPNSVWAKNRLDAGAGSVTATTGTLGSLTVTNTASANLFSGSGASLTTLNGSSISSGMVGNSFLNIGFGANQIPVLDGSANFVFNNGGKIRVGAASIAGGELEVDGDGILLNSSIAIQNYAALTTDGTSPSILSGSITATNLTNNINLGVTNITTLGVGITNMFVDGNWPAKINFTITNDLCFVGITNAPKMVLLSIRDLGATNHNVLFPAQFQWKGTTNIISATKGTNVLVVVTNGLVLDLVFDSLDTTVAPSATNSQVFMQQ